MTQTQNTVDPAVGTISKALTDLLFTKLIKLIKTVGCYIYMTFIITLVSVLSMMSVILVGILIGMVFGKVIGILAGVLLFGIIIVGPFSNWMKAIKAATKREFFGKTDD